MSSKQQRWIAAASADEAIGALTKEVLVTVKTYSLVL